LALDQKYAALKVQAAKENARLQKEVNEKILNDSVRILQSETDEAKKQLSKQLDDLKEFERKRGAEQENQLEKQKELNKELIKLEQQKADAIKAIDEKSKKEQIDYQRDLDEIFVNDAQNVVTEIGVIYNGIYEIRQQQLQNQLTLLQRTSDEEIRLAGDNIQKVNTLKEKQAQKEKEIRTQQFQAQKQAAIANAIFQATPQIVAYAINPVTVPLAIAAGAILATQIAFIAAQPVPEFKEGTKGKAHEGRAWVGDGYESELLVTKSGKVAWTPATPTLVNFKEPTEVFNQSQLKNEVFFSNSTSKKPGSNGDTLLLSEVRGLRGDLKSLPITEWNISDGKLKEYVHTKVRTTEIRNSRSPRR
jgi:hypothetical protein